MTKEDFLQIFKSGFHKLTLKKLVKINSQTNKYGRKYDNYLGLFEFYPPQQVWMDKKPIDYNFLKSLLKQFKKELSNCVTHKFTKKVFHKDKMVLKQTTKYVFDIIPKNVVTFKFDRQKKTMILVVKGYCLTK